MLSLIEYFLYIRESKILHYFDYLKILQQWKVGNGFVDLKP